MSEYLDLAHLERFKGKLHAPGNAGAHNSIYRGKLLGSSVTADQWNCLTSNAESNGTLFKDMYVGDYWQNDVTINGVTKTVRWYVAGFNYWKKSGVSNHVVIVPNRNLVESATINASETAAGSYFNSDFRTGNNSNTARSTCRTIIEGVFATGSGSTRNTHILTYQGYVKKSLASGGRYEASGGWEDCDIELPTENHMFGCTFFSNACNGTAIAHRQTYDTTQLPLFTYDSSLIPIGSSYWLRDIASDTSWTIVSGGGTCGQIRANYSDIGIRPVFAICA